MNRLIITATLIAGMAPLAPVAALDAACDPIITAGERKMEQAAWYAVSESKGIKMETIKVDGQFFVRIGEKKWQKAPSLDRAARVILDLMRSGVVKVTDCKDEGSEILDGNATHVISYTVVMPGLPAASPVRLNIGKDDGLPYRESAQNGQTTIHSRYRNIVAPKLSGIELSPMAELGRFCIDECERWKGLFSDDRRALLQLPGLLRATIQHRRRLRVLITGAAHVDELDPMWADLLVYLRELDVGPLTRPVRLDPLSRPSPDFPPDAIPPAVAEAVWSRTLGQPYLTNLVQTTPAAALAVHEQAGHRPALVVSPAAYKERSWP